MGWCLLFLLVTVVWGQETAFGVVEHNHVHPADELAGTDLVMACVMFRHGDRTPDQEELDLYPDAAVNNKNLFYPYGTKALTNKGKQRGFLVGQYLRQRYNQLISRLYLPDEISVRTTEYARTKMTALTALAALYPPPPAQRWNPALDWQPVPYDTVPYTDDDLLYWYNCPRYLWLRNQVYKRPEVKETLNNYQDFFSLLTEKTGMNITTTEDVFFLDNLFQTLANVGVEPPRWAMEVMPQINEVTRMEYNYEFYDDELIRLATGVLMCEIVNATKAAISGQDQAKLRLYSAHENNVAALMAAARVFTPHQPKYGATFSIELRRSHSTGQFYITTVYAAEAGGPGKVLTIPECGGHALCDYETFLQLTNDTLMSYDVFREECKKLR